MRNRCCILEKKNCWTSILNVFTSSLCFVKLLKMCNAILFNCSDIKMNLFFTIRKIIKINIELIISNYWVTRSSSQLQTLPMLWQMLCWLQKLIIKKIHIINSYNYFCFKEFLVVLYKLIFCLHFCNIYKSSFQFVFTLELDMNGLKKCKFAFQDKIPTDKRILNHF